jgi:hypothetical protein
MPTDRLSSPILRTALGLLALQVAATVIAIAADWRTCFDQAAAHLTVVEAFPGHGSAISAPLAPLALLLACGLVGDRRDRWGTAGVAGVCLVALLVAFGAVGEAVSAPSAQTSRAVLVFAGLFGLVQAAWLLTAARAARRRRALAPS